MARPSDQRAEGRRASNGRSCARGLDEHRQLLSDEARIRAFEAALNETVKPHHVVLDLGAGTGILGLLACRAGARHVYSIDSGGIIQVARDISRAASHFLLNQLPELYAGLQRDPTSFPIQYLGANVPQAWAAGRSWTNSAPAQKPNR